MVKKANEGVTVPLWLMHTSVHACCDAYTHAQHMCAHSMCACMHTRIHGMHACMHARCACTHSRRACTNVHGMHACMHACMHGTFGVLLQVLMIVWDEKTSVGDLVVDGLKISTHARTFR